MLVQGTETDIYDAVGCMTMETDGEAGVLCWDATVSPFDRTAVMQIILAIGIPFGAIAVLLLAVSEGDPSAMYGAGFVMVVILGGIVLGLLLFNRKNVRYTLDSDGAGFRDLPKSVGKAERIRTLVIRAGAAGGNPSVAGAGVLMQTEDSARMLWKDVRSATPVPGRGLIRLSGKGRDFTIKCAPEGYLETLAFIATKVPGRIKED